MSVEGKHTPLPWKLQPFFDPEEYPAEAGMACIVGENLGGIVAAGMPCPTEIDSGDFTRVEANARLIVQAVNSYYELLEALRAMVDTYVELGNSGDAGFWDPERVSEVIAARAAISKATMGEGGEG